jgi:hypothetical protein
VTDSRCTPVCARKAIFLYSPPDYLKKYKCSFLNLKDSKIIFIYLPIMEPAANAGTAYKSFLAG